MGTPASIRARVEPQMEAWEVEPLEESTSDTRRRRIGELLNRRDHRHAGPSQPERRDRSPGGPGLGKDWVSPTE